MKYIHLTFVAFFTTSFLSFSSFSYDDLINYYKNSSELSVLPPNINNFKVAQFFELFKREYSAGLQSTLDITGLPSKSRIDLLKLIIEYTRTVSKINTPTTFMIGSYLYAIKWKTGELMGIDKKPIRTNKDLSHLAARLTNQFPLKNEQWEKINNKLVQQQIDGMVILLDNEDSIMQVTGERFLNGLNLFLDYKAAKICTPSTLGNKIKKLLQNEKERKNIKLPSRNLGAQRFQSL